VYPVGGDFSFTEQIMTPRHKDELFRKSGKTEKFEFNESVARVFDNMLERSVPFYKECQSMVVELVKEHVQPDTSVYDLGCSTGTLIKYLAQAIPKKSKIRFVGIDNSAPMLKKAKRKLKDPIDRCELVEADLNEKLEINNASVIVMNYTLQFIPPPNRAAMLQRLHKALLPGGCLILIEKVRGETADLDDAFVDQYYRYKQEHGYSRMEIAKKREALEDVLVPLKPSENVKLLSRAGFGTVDVFFKWFNFAGFLALKKRLGRTKRAKGKA